MQHPDEGTIHAWLDGALAPDEAEQVRAHVTECTECAVVLAEARGLIAAASRILTALDDVPAGVIPAVPSVRTGDELAVLRQRKRAQRRWWQRPGVAVAAGLLLMAGGTFVVLRRAPNGEVRDMSAAAPRPDSAAPAPAALSAPAAGNAAVRSDRPTAIDSPRATGKALAGRAAPPAPSPAVAAKSQVVAADVEKKVTTARAADVSPAAPIAPVPAPQAAEALRSRASIRAPAAVIETLAGCYELEAPVGVAASEARLPTRLMLDSAATMVRGDSGWFVARTITSAPERARVSDALAVERVDMAWRPLDLSSAGTSRVEVVVRRDSMETVYALTVPSAAKALGFAGAPSQALRPEEARADTARAWVARRVRCDR